MTHFAQAATTVAVHDWQKELAEGFKTPSELLDALGLSGRAGIAHEAQREFPTRVPRCYVQRMRFGDPSDPLLLQVLPTSRETAPAPGYSLDPVEDLAARGATGVLHKYHGRALLIATGACAIHCRYCFRRHFPYSDEHAGRNGWREALEYLSQHTDISEVILSGGDPLTLTDRRLRMLTDQFSAMPHIRRLRIHTRLPVVLPRRVTKELTEWLGRVEQVPVVVIHANHANELDDAVSDALGRLRSAGVALLNQTVLLKNVNDSVDALCALSERLFEMGVVPYYLHLLDRVRGAAHFRVPERRAKGLAAEIAARLPGYLVPRLVREEAGRPGKTLIPPARSRCDDGSNAPEQSH